MNETFKPIGSVAAGIVEELRAKMVERGRMVTEPGFYRMPAARYHADPCPDPSLSNSIAKIIVDQSPRHAWIAHPRLNRDHKDSDPNRTREIGSVWHAMVLGAGVETIKVIDADDYKTKDAKQARADGYAADALPILAPDYEIARKMARIAMAEFMEYPEIAPVLAEGGGISETVAIWREGEMWCRSMIDRMSHDKRIVLDLKSTGDAHPGACAARISNNNFQMQDPFYQRGLDALDSAGRGRRKFFFLYQEQEEPFACTVHQLDGQHRHFGERQVETAIRIWSRCMADGRERQFWPAYPRVIHQVAMKPWREEQWLAREVEEFDREQAARSTIAPDHMMAG